MSSPNASTRTAPPQSPSEYPIDLATNRRYHPASDPNDLRQGCEYCYETKRSRYCDRRKSGNDPENGEKIYDLTCGTCARAGNICYYKQRGRYGRPIAPYNPPEQHQRSRKSKGGRGGCYQRGDAEPGGGSEVDTRAGRVPSSEVCHPPTSPPSVPRGAVEPSPGVFVDGMSVDGFITPTFVRTVSHPTSYALGLAWNGPSTPAVEGFTTSDRAFHNQPISEASPADSTLYGSPAFTRPSHSSSDSGYGSPPWGHTPMDSSIFSPTPSILQDTYDGMLRGEGVLDFGTPSSGVSTTLLSDSQRAASGIPHSDPQGLLDEYLTQAEIYSAWLQTFGSSQTSEF